MGNEVTIKIAAQADPSLTQIPAQVKQNLEKAFQAVEAVPQDMNQKFVDALKGIEAESARASSAIVAELKQISSEVSSFQNQMAQSNEALADSINQMFSAGTGVEEIKEQVKEGASEALQAAEAIKLFTEVTVGFLSESVIHGVELTKELDEVRDRLENITHSTTKTQEIMRSVDSASLDIGSFNLTGLRTASVQLALFHQDSKKHLIETADLASYAGKSIEETAITFGRAMEGQRKAFNTLMTQYDIGPGELAMFGAALDKNGKLMLDTSAHIDKARGALEKWIQTYAEGASGPSSLDGNIQATQNAIQLLQEELAKPMLPVLQTLTFAIRDTSRYLISLPEGIKSTTAALATIGGGTAIAVAAFIALAGPINQIINLCGTLGQTIPALSGPMAKLGASAAALAAPVTILIGLGVTIGFAIENWKRKEEELSDALQKQSKVMATVKREWEEYVKLINEAGKGKGPDLSPSNAPPAKKVQEIKEKLQTIEPADVLEVMDNKGISEEQLKKARDNSEANKKNTTAELELLRKAKQYKIPVYADMTEEERKKWTPQAINQERQEFAKHKSDYQTLPNGSDMVNVKDLTEEERKQFKELTKDAKSYADVLQIINDKKMERAKYLQSAEATGAVLSKAGSASTAAERVKDLTESTDAAIKYSEKFKNPEGEKGNMAGDMQRLELLKNTEKKIAEEIKSTFGLESVTTETVLKKLENTHTTTMRGMLEKYLDYANKVEDTQKSIVQGEIKNLDDALTAKKQNIQTSMELDKMSQDQKVAAEKKILKELNDITAPENKQEQTYKVGGEKHTFIGADGASKYAGEGPETELDHQRKLYQTNKDYRDKVEKEKAAIEKNVMSDTKKAESDHLKDLETKYENYLSSRRVATNNDIRAQISDLNYIASEYQKNADDKVITEEAAAKKRADIFKKTADLEVKFKEKAFDESIKLSQAHQQASDVRLKTLEKEMDTGKNVQGAIIAEVKKRLDYEMQMIDLKAQKDLESSTRTLAAQEAIFLESQAAKHDALEKEKTYIDGIIKKEESSLNSIEGRVKQFGGFSYLNAFGKGKGQDEIPSISGFSSQIDINAKTKNQTQLQSYSDQLKSQIKSMGTLGDNLTTLNASVVNLTQTLAGESKASTGVSDESPMKAAGWSKNGFNATALEDMVAKFGQSVTNKTQNAQIQQVINIGSRGVTPTADLKQHTNSMLQAAGRMVSNSGILNTMGKGWGFDTFSQGGWGFIPVSKDPSEE